MFFLSHFANVPAQLNLHMFMQILTWSKVGKSLPEYRNCYCV